jgi:putative membrane protein
MLRNMLLQLIANAAAIVVTAYFLPNEVNYYGNFQTVALFALVLGLCNAVLTPVLNLITWPLACLTFGLFRFVVNVAVFLIAALLLPGNVLQVTLLGAVVGSLVAAVVSAALSIVLGEGRR